MLSIARRVFNADRLGIAASSLCVVHCLLTPVLISASAVLAHTLPSEEHTHRVLAVAVTAVGAFALLRGFRKHGRRRVLACLAVGLALIFTGAMFGDKLPSHLAEVAITMAGSTLLIGAHRMNHTFCKQCSTCVPCCESKQR